MRVKWTVFDLNLIKDGQSKGENSTLKFSTEKCPSEVSFDLINNIKLYQIVIFSLQSPLIFKGHYHYIVH